MAYVTLELTTLLFEDEIEVWNDGGEDQPELTMSLADLFEGYVENLKDYSVEEATQYVMTTLEALDAGKAQLLNALEEMKARLL